MKFRAPTIRGRIDRCWLFVFRTPASAVAGLLPPTLDLVTVDGFAFWNVVTCELSAMRPAGLPGWLGLSYRHVAYRLHVTARTAAGSMIEGLHFIRSDCDRRLVEVVGNLATDFRFHPARIRFMENAAAVSGEIESPDARAHFRIDRTVPPSLTAGSPFSTLAAAARALEYRPAAISAAGPAAVEIVRVRRDAATWKWRPVHVAESRWQFLDHRPVQLELCYEVAPVEYIWERSRIEPVVPCAS